MSNALEERGRALEDEFFHKENTAKLAAMRRGEVPPGADPTRETGRRNGGRADECSRLESGRAERPRGFESPPFRGQVVDGQPMLSIRLLTRYSRQLT